MTRDPASFGDEFSNYRTLLAAAKLLEPSPDRDQRSRIYEILLTQCPPPPPPPAPPTPT